MGWYVCPSGSCLLARIASFTLETEVRVGRAFLISRPCCCGIASLQVTSLI